jgi:hypothetical protein
VLWTDGRQTWTKSSTLPPAIGDRLQTDLLDYITTEQFGQKMIITKLKKEPSTTSSQTFTFQK